jgi:hypothetical protein
VREKCRACHACHACRLTKCDWAVMWSWAVEWSSTVAVSLDMPGRFHAHFLFGLSSPPVSTFRRVPNLSSSVRKEVIYGCSAVLALNHLFCDCVVSWLLRAHNTLHKIRPFRTGKRPTRMLRSPVRERSHPLGPTRDNVPSNGNNRYINVSMVQLTPDCAYWPRLMTHMFLVLSTDVRRLSIPHFSGQIDVPMTPPVRRIKSASMLAMPFHSWNFETTPS